MEFSVDFRGNAQICILLNKSLEFRDGWGKNWCNAIP